jgi:hypothetical protein
MSTVDLEWLRKTVAEMLTQDNAMTSDPIPTVQERVGSNWVIRESFLTTVEAKTYCVRQAHNYRGKLRVYIESACRNPEMRKLREQLFALDAQLNGGAP